MMQSHDVWAVCKDPGGTAGILPVVDELRKRSQEVLLITNGWARDRRNVGHETLARDFWDTETALTATGHLPHVLITSMCSGGGVGRDLVPHMRERGIPTVALQDIWGEGLWGSWADEQYRPDHIAVNDELGGRLVTDAWPEFDPTYIHQTGFPAFDRFAEFDVQGASQRVREYFDVPDNARIILFTGGGVHTAHALAELTRAINAYAYSSNVYMIARPHPRMKVDFPGDIPEWNKAIRALQIRRDLGPRLLHDQFDMFGIDELIAASTIVVASASTINTEACLIRRPNISIEYPNRTGAHLATAIPGLTT